MIDFLHKNIYTDLGLKKTNIVHICNKREIQLSYMATGVLSHDICKCNKEHYFMDAWLPCRSVPPVTTVSIQVQTSLSGRIYFCRALILQLPILFQKYWQAPLIQLTVLFIQCVVLHLLTAAS